MFENSNVQGTDLERLNVCRNVFENSDVRGTDFENVDVQTACLVPCATCCFEDHNDDSFYLSVGSETYLLSKLVSRGKNP